MLVNHQLTGEIQGNLKVQYCYSREKKLKTIIAKVPYRQYPTTLKPYIDLYYRIDDNCRPEIYYFHGNLLRTFYDRGCQIGIKISPGQFLFMTAKDLVNSTVSSFKGIIKNTWRRQSLLSNDVYGLKSVCVCVCVRGGGGGGGGGGVRGLISAQENPGMERRD